jgi:hypothetical protein
LRIKKQKIMITREKYLEALDIVEAYHKQLNLSIVRRSRLSPGDKLICRAKGAAYGDTFTVQDPMYDDGMILQCDQYGSWTSLKDVDLTEFDYA